MRRIITLFVSFILSFMFLELSPSQAGHDGLYSRGTIKENEVNKKIERRASSVSEDRSFLFGFDLRAGPVEDARQYIPFLRFLSHLTNYTFKLRFTPRDSSIIDDLGAGKVHFAAIGATSFIQAQEKYGAVSLVRGINSKGKTQYRSVIVVLPESPIQNLEDLRGKRFAFGNVSSTQGHLIPRILLHDRGIRIDDFAGYRYTKSHHNCAITIIQKQFDACGLQDTMGQALASQGLVRVLHTSRYYPSSGIAANKDVPGAIINAVKRALLDFDPLGRDAKALYHWHLTEMPNGFGEAMPGDYRELRRAMIRFGLIGGAQE